MWKVMGILISLVVLACAGCSDFSRSEQQETVAEAELKVSKEMQNSQSGTIEEISDICRDIYVQAKTDGVLWSLETTEMLMERLGQEGYTTVHRDNQLDMKNPEPLKDFCKSVEEEEAAELLLIMVLDGGGVVQFDLHTEAGVVEVAAKSLSWKENSLVNMDMDHYQASPWVCAGNDYLFFDRYYMEGFSGPYDYVAIRMEPLDNVCRELNRTYILSLGYGSNNLFTTNWDETNCRDLNFYDLFEVLRTAEPLVQTEIQTPDSMYCEGKVYQVAKEEFESVIQSRIAVDSGILEDILLYSPNTGTYEYRRRGMKDSGTGVEAPYPEVVDYKKNDDGTIELMVNAVWPEQKLETAFSHKVTVRPLPDGGFQYVSNQITGWADGVFTLLKNAE